MYPAAANSSYPLKGTIPSTQAASTSLTYGYMYADPVQKSVEARKTVTDINLYFRPSFTAFHFTLKNSGSEAITLYSFELTSPTNALNGDIEYITGSTPTVSHKVGTGVTTGEKTITVNNITVPGKVGSTDGSIDFIITTLPNSYASLTARIKTTADGSPKTLTMAPTGGFAATMKHNITMTLPDFGSAEYTFSVTPSIELSYEAGITSGVVVNSYKTIGSTTTPVTWEIEGVYSDASCTTPAFSSIPSWITTSISPASPAAATQNLSIDHPDLTPNNAEIIPSANVANAINSAIAARGSVGSPDNPVNLANPNNEGSTPSSYIAESANCYIVNAKGWYKIPLVMGNGVKNNRINTPTRIYEGYSANYSQYFRDYTNHTISSPLLQSSSNYVASINSVAPICLDVQGLILPSECSKINDPSTTDDSSPKNVYWLQFKVEKAEQGNAIIVVKDVNDNIMWSYHIWVCDHNAGDDVSATSSSPKFMPYPLGWKATGGSAEKGRFEVFVRLQRNSGPEEGKYAVIRLYCTDLITQSSSTTGDAPFYQWGRKDPLTTSLNFQVYSGTVGFTNGYYYSIIYPNKVLKNNQSGLKTWWNGTGTALAASNLWNAYYTNTNSTSSPLYNTTHTVTKTIYDPSPAGYHVPSPSQFENELNICAPDLYWNPRSGASTTTGNEGKLYFWTTGPTTTYGNARYIVGTLNSTTSSYEFSATNFEFANALHVLPVRESSN